MYFKLTLNKINVNKINANFRNLFWLYSSFPLFSPLFSSFSSLRFFLALVKAAVSLYITNFQYSETSSCLFVYVVFKVS